MIDPEDDDDYFVWDEDDDGQPDLAKEYEDLYDGEGHLDDIERL